LSPDMPAFEHRTTTFSLQPPVAAALSFGECVLGYEPGTDSGAAQIRRPPPARADGGDIAH
jgi:hypothetical protein